MLQLELEPKYMPNNRSPEQIGFYQSQILRIFSSGGRRKLENENYYHPISLDRALGTLYGKSYKYFKQVSDDDGSDLDKWVGKVLSKSLPFLYGIEGDFRSFTDFRRAMFDREILYHSAVDRHRLITGQKGKDQLVDPFPLREVRKRNLEGFQLPLLNLIRVKHPLVDLSANEQFMADLKNSERVLRGDMFSWEPNYFSRLSQHKQKALDLWLKYPPLTCVQIVQVLKEEDLGEFPSSTVRVWVKRALDNEVKVSAKFHLMENQSSR